MAPAKAKQDNGTDTPVYETVAAQQEQPAAELMPAASDFTRDELASIETFDDAVRLAESAYGVTVFADSNEAGIGDGFKVGTEDDKARLVGVPLYFLEWTFREGDYGDGGYASVKCIQRDDAGRAVKWILNDGSTGIYEQLRDFARKTGRQGGLAVKHGLRVSEYPTNAIDGHVDYGKPLSKAEHREMLIAGKAVGKGRTFYIDTSA